MGAVEAEEGGAGPAGGGDVARNDRETLIYSVPVAVAVRGDENFVDLPLPFAQQPRAGFDRGAGDRWLVVGVFPKGGGEVAELPLSLLRQTAVVGSLALPGQMTDEEVAADTGGRRVSEAGFPFRFECGFGQGLQIGLWVVHGGVSVHPWTLCWRRKSSPVGGRND